MRQAAHTNLQPPDDHAQAFLSEFAPMRHSHYLLEVYLDPEHSISLVDEALSSMAEGSLEPIVDSGDDPSWADALASLDCEFWIAGAREEIESLENLKVFVLVPRSEVPRGQRPLKGKLVCKWKCDDSGNIVCYKVHYVAKGYAQRYGCNALMGVKARH